MGRILVVFGILILLISCKSTETEKTSLFKMNDDSVNLYAFIGEKISVRESERDAAGTNKIIGFDGDTVVIKDHYFDQKFEAKYRVLNNVFNKLPGDTIEFIVYDHYGRPQFEKYENVILYISFIKEKGNYFHQKYQFDPVKKSENGDWKGLNGESIEELFNLKKTMFLQVTGR